jgi:hypothetical protein
MKYAFIALVACYLLVYGCGPDNSKKEESKPDKATHSTVVTPPPAAPPVITGSTSGDRAAGSTYRTASSRPTGPAAGSTTSRS